MTETMEQTIARLAALTADGRRAGHTSEMLEVWNETPALLAHIRELQRVLASYHYVFAVAAELLEATAAQIDEWFPDDQKTGVQADLRQTAVAYRLMAGTEAVERARAALEGEEQRP